MQLPIAGFKGAKNSHVLCKSATEREPIFSGEPHEHHQDAFIHFFAHRRSGPARLRERYRQ
jgi:hypothetical protein